jgi:hypothetical protein
MDEEKTIQQQINEVQKDIEILNHRKKLKNTKCDICECKGCNVISFYRRKPVHDKCNRREMKRLNFIGD